MVCDALDTAIRSGALICHDPNFWRECSTFQRGPTGKPEALPGCHDDRVMAMAIGAYLLTLGRNAWGLEALAGADAAGFPVAPINPTTTLPPKPSIPQPQPMGAPDPTVFDALAEERASLRRITCETCNAFTSGFCATNRFTCRSSDPSCPWYYPREIAEEADTIPPIAGEVGW
jgi:hypothetical protein